jgi:hypothetical protein
MITVPNVPHPCDPRVPAPHSGDGCSAPKRRSVWFGASPWWAVLLFAACDATGNGPVLDLPPRPSGAPGGAEIARDIRALVGSSLPTPRTVNRFNPSTSA